MSLRLKILSGFLALAVMLLLAGVWAIYELNTLGSGPEALLADNYRSITATNTMMEALEREDSAILLLMLGHWEEGRGILGAADSLFQVGLKGAAGNITIADEAVRIDSIRKAYARYKGRWERPIVSTSRQGNIDWYFEEMHGDFQAVKTHLGGLRQLNSETMYRTAETLRRRGDRAIMPAVVAIVAAVVFALLFNLFLHVYVIQPLRGIIAAIRRFLDEGETPRISIETSDEIRELGNLVNLLSSRAGRRHPD